LVKEELKSQLFLALTDGQKGDIMQHQKIERLCQEMLAAVQKIHFVKEEKVKV
jgi:hypothetical protein